MVGRSVSVLDRAKAHFKLGRECIEVPEWGESPDKPLKVYSTPLTLREKQKIAQWTDDNNEGTARAVILKATDKDGNKLFQQGDLAELMRFADSSVLERIAFWISEGVDLNNPDGAIEESVKNSEPIPS